LCLNLLPEGFRVAAALLPTLPEVRLIRGQQPNGRCWGIRLSHWRRYKAAPDGGSGETQVAGNGSNQHPSGKERLDLLIARLAPLARDRLLTSGSGERRRYRCRLQPCASFLLPSAKCGTAQRPMLAPEEAFDRLPQAVQKMPAVSNLLGLRRPQARSFVWIAHESCRNRNVKLAAIWRNRVIYPEQYEDEEQARTSAARAVIPVRTTRLWRHAYRVAEGRYGSGFLGLLPRFTDRGGARKLAPTTLALIHEVLTSHYDTTVRAPRRGAYGEYVRRAAEQHRAPVSQRTFYREAHRHKAAYDQALAREGKRAAYALKDYARPREPTVSRHGDYAWAMAHLDHTEVDLELRDAHTGVPLGRCWLTLLILAASRRIAACSLSFDPPSYRSCMMVLRLCVKRHGRLPTAVTVDGGPEFRGVYFEQLLALYRVRKHQRPAAEPRFGSVVERLFGTLNTQLIHHLLGNTQAAARPRLLTAESDPRSQSVWTLASFAERVRHWADQEYDTLPHPALGQSPREAYAQSLARDGERRHKRIAYDQDFILATLPTTTRGAALVQPGRGVRIHYLDYWCEEMRDPLVERTHVPVRFDPFDVSVGYAYIGGRWRCCQCACDALAGCSERELQILAEEVRMRNRLLHGREHLEITQQQLAAFRRETAARESVLRQQRRDREAKAAFTVLEGGLRLEAQTGAGGREAAPPADPAGAADEPLLVLRRYRP